MSDQSARYGWNHLDARQEDNHGNLNINCALFEALATLEIIDEVTDDAALLATITNGDVYMVRSPPTGGFAGWGGALALWHNGWRFLYPRPGLGGTMLNRNGTYWVWDALHGNWATIGNVHDTANEVPVSEYNLNDKPRHSKTVGWNANSSAGAWTYPHGATVDANELITMEVGTLVSPGGVHYPLNYSDGTIDVAVSIDATNIIVTQSVGLPGYVGQLVMRYSKP